MRNSQRERIITLSATIQALRSEVASAKANLADAERELDALLSAADVYEPAPLVERIVSALDQEPETVFTAEELLKRFPDGERPPLASLRSTLVRLEAAGKVLKPGRGSYRSIHTSAALHLVSETAANG